MKRGLGIAIVSVLVDLAVLLATARVASAAVDASLKIPGIDGEGPNGSIVVLAYSFTPDWGEQVKAVIEPAAGVSPGPSLADELLDFCAGRIAK